jgi:phosphoglycerate dehydrogenase-like enzyme
VFDVPVLRDVVVAKLERSAGGVGVSELTWALILALARNVPAEDRATREGAW